MRIRHNLGPRDENDFAVSTSEQLIDLWKSISQGVMLALVALVSISMVVGGIVLMNTMLVSVTERTREIGVRKAHRCAARRHRVAVPGGIGHALRVRRNASEWRSGS